MQLKYGHHAASNTVLVQQYGNEIYGFRVYELMARCGMIVTQARLKSSLVLGQVTYVRVAYGRPPANF